jgi:hypothetical protein
LKKIDAVLAWLMILLGVLHIGAAWITIRGFAVGALWGFAGGAAIIEAGLLNLVRQSSPRGLARAGSIAGNLLVTVLLLSIGWNQVTHLVHHLHFFLIAAVVIAELVFSLKG